MASDFFVSADKVDNSYSFTKGSGSLAPRTQSFATGFDGRWVDWLNCGTVPDQKNHGTPVTEKAAIGWAPLWRAFNIIAGYVAKTPIDLFQRGDNDQRTRAVDEIAHRIMKYDAHPMVDAFTFRETLSYHAQRRGNGYGFINRSGNMEPGEGLPQELTILDPRPDRTYPVIQFVSKDDGVEVKTAVFDRASAEEVQRILENCESRLFYVTNANDVIKRQRKLDARDVFHIKGLSDDGICGHDVFDLFKAEIGLGIETREHKYHFYKSGGIDGGVLMFPGSTSPEKQRETMKYWNEVRSGPTAFTRIAKLQGETTFEQNSQTSKGSETQATREFQIAMASDITGVPQHKLGGRRVNSYNSIEAEDRRFLSDTLDVHLCKFENEARKKMLSTSQRESGMYFEFNRSRLVQPTTRDNIEAGDKIVNQGLATLNDWLKSQNLPESSCPTADRLRLPLNIGFCDDPNREVPGSTEDAAAGETQSQISTEQQNSIATATESAIKQCCKRISKAAVGASKTWQNFEEFLNHAENKHQKPAAEIFDPINQVRNSFGLESLENPVSLAIEAYKNLALNWVSDQQKKEKASDWIKNDIATLSKSIKDDWPNELENLRQKNEDSN